MQQPLRLRTASWPRFGLILAVSFGCGHGALGQEKAPPTPGQSADQKRSERLLEHYAADSALYTFYRDEKHKEKLAVRKTPVYIWLNPIRNSGQYGAVYVWTHRGGAEVLGTIFSNPSAGNASNQREIYHEFHTLSPVVLHPELQSRHRWQPEAGVVRKPIPDAPAAADTARQRTIQLRALARDFTAHSIDADANRWEMRILPQPIYRYEIDESENPAPEVVDGAVLAFVTNAGTDPEVILLLEARRTKAGLQWEYGLARFSDQSLYVQHKGAEVWSAIRDAANPWSHDALHRYDPGLPR